MRKQFTEEELDEFIAVLLLDHSWDELRLRCEAMLYGAPPNAPVMTYEERDLWAAVFARVRKPQPTVLDKIIRAVEDDEPRPDLPSFL